ncbi:MAG TPA: hypothetical protein VHA52_01755 [Candidatus Babeliaceae bacterium]|nr:hypothetical protein [Candidatus Babeliaceae bacterium]
MTLGSGFYGCGHYSKASVDSFVCPTNIVRDIQSPSIIITKIFTDKYNLSSFFAAPGDSTGDFGIFDSSLWRLQVRFTSLKRDNAKHAVYYIVGADRRKKEVRWFSGYLHIDTVRMYDRNYWFSKDTGDCYPSHDFAIWKSKEYDEKNIAISATFALYEDSLIKGAGIYKGTLFFELSFIDSSKTLVDNQIEYNGVTGDRNFTYEGVFKPYHSSKTTYVKWSPDPIDELMGGCDGGAYCWLPVCNDPEMVAHGWETNDNGELIDNPRLWWMKK